MFLAEEPVDVGGYIGYVLFFLVCRGGGEGWFVGCFFGLVVVLGFVWCGFWVFCGRFVGGLMVVFAGFVL